MVGSDLFDAIKSYRINESGVSDHIAESEGSDKSQEHTFAR